MINMKDCIDFVLKNEGSEYTNDPEDSGHATRWGITQEDLSRFMGHSASEDDVRNMTKDTAMMIYQRFYWGPMHMAELNDVGIATAVFDIGVNRGIVRGIKYAQIACNRCSLPTEDLVIDGHIGPKTIAALKYVARANFLHRFHDIVYAGYDSIVANNPSQQVFIKGWHRRADRLLTLI